MESQQQHWADFRVHPDWKVLSVDPEYANTIIRPNAYLLNPTDYSDI